MTLASSTTRWTGASAASASLRTRHTWSRSRHADSDSDDDGLTPEQKVLQLEGWVRFGLNLDESRVDARNVWETWDTAFHGTTADSFQKIVETGYLLIPGDVTPEGVRLGVRDGHIKGGHVRAGRKESGASPVRTGGGAGMRVPLETFEPHKMAFTSKSLAYAADDCYAQPCEFKGRAAKTVLKLKVHPDSHPTPPVDEDGGTGGSTLRRTPHDPFVAEDEMEWYTSRHGVHILTDILIKVDCSQQMLRQARRKIAAQPAGTSHAPGKWSWLKNLSGDRSADSSWEPYPEDVNERIEAAWEDGDEAVDSGGGYHIDLEENMQVKTAEPHRQRPVRRVGRATAAQKERLMDEVSQLQGNTAFGESRDSVTNACGFHRTCWEVLQRVTGGRIHAGHWNHLFDRCFCEECMAARGDREAYTNVPAHGPGTYVLPKGYAKFALKIDGARAEARGFWSDCKSSIIIVRATP